MLNLITGKPGSGKSLYLAKIVRDLLLPQGVEVWSYKSFKFHDPRVKYWNELTDIPKKPNVAVVIDEVQEFINARDWPLLPRVIRILFSQHRHFGWDLFGATQHPLLVDVNARRIVENYYEIIQVFGTKIKRGILPKKPWGIFAVRRFDIKEADKLQRTTSGIKFFRADKKLFDFYDTLCDFDIELKQDNISLVELYTCPHCHHKKVLWGREHPVENFEKNSQKTAVPF